MPNLLLYKRRNPRPLAGGDLPPVAGNQTVNYTVDNVTDFANPERGWYVEGNDNFSGNSNNASPVSSVAPYPTLQMRFVRLDSYRTSDTLPTSFLNTLASEMAAWRSSGRKAVLRYAYNRGASTTDNDATLARILNHISQLSPLWHEYKDVIAVLQAGFIGRWGEWNSSSSGNLTKSNRNTIIDALLDATPPEMMVQLRKPLWHYDRWATPFDPELAWSGTAQSRAGMMNDSFLVGTGHGGTFYTGDGMTFAQMRDYWETISRFVSYGGESAETTLSSSVNGGAAAIAEMQTYHMDYLHSRYWVDMYQNWSDNGYLPEISRRLGYRLALTSATLPTSVSAGSLISVTLNIQNSGFGKVFNPRPINLVLKASGKSDINIQLVADARPVLPVGGESKTVTLTGSVPSGVESGNYSAYLHLPDPSPNLATDSRYSIRLANSGVWSMGMNNLNATISVSGTTPGGGVIGYASVSTSLTDYPKSANTTTGNYYVATNGSDSNSGTSVSTPFATIGKALSVVSSGQTILVRAGTYNLTSRISVNTAWGSKVKLWGYGSERPVINGATISGDARVVYLQSASRNLHIKGIEIRDAKDTALQVEGQNHIIEDVIINGSIGTGLYQFGGANNLYQDCVVIRLGDGSNSDTNTPDGLAITHVSSSVYSTGNAVVRCLVANGADDGFDFFRARGTQVIDCVSIGAGRYWNGTSAGDGSGFKEGGTPAFSGSGGGNTFKGCIALGAKNYGFNDNSSQVGNTVQFNTAVNTTGHGYANNTDTCSDNISWNNSPNASNTGGSRNSWNLSNQNPQFETDYSLKASSPYRTASANGTPIGASTIAIALLSKWYNHSKIWIPGRGAGPGGTGLPGDT